MTTLRFPASAWSVAVVVLAACSGASGAEPVPSPSARVVTTAAVVDTTMAPPVQATGVLAAREETDLAFTVGGVLAEVAVRAGDQVRAGQVLARLDAAQVEAQLAGVTAQLTKAERDLARAERLLADSVVSRATVEDARTARDAARASVDAARFARRTAVITAPSAGVVLAREADPGTVVAAGTPVLRVAGSGRGTVLRAALPDRDVLRVRVGDVAEVQLDAAPDVSYRGRVVEVAAAPTTGTGTWPVSIAVDAAADLPRGLTGTVMIRSGRATAVRLVPLAAIVEANADRGVLFTFDAGIARRHEVQLGGVDGEMVVVQRGLTTGARVITAGAAWLSDGESVREATQ